MRFVIAAAALATVLFGAASAQAEKTHLHHANNADGYGVDRCLASGAECGATVANSYCKSRDYAQALSFSKVDRGRHHRRHSDQRPGLMQRRDVRQLRRHRLLALVLSDHS